MGIAVDQAKLRRIVRTLLPTESLNATETAIMLRFLRIAAGADDQDEATEHAILQNIAQCLGALTGIKPGDVLPIAVTSDEVARRRSLAALGATLDGRGIRDLTYALSFLVCVADLDLAPSERGVLEDVQHALGIDHRDATELTVFLTEIVAEGPPRIA